MRYIVNFEVKLEKFISFILFEDDFDFIDLLEILFVGSFEGEFYEILVVGSF